MSDVKISVIMPVYKVEKYIRKAIESIQNQTLTEFEFLIVDDGTPDNSGKISDEYAMKDSRIHVIHKENGGAPSARNTAMDIAKGKYYYFMDSDDWAEPTMLQDMYDLAEQHQLELVVSGYYIDTYYDDHNYITTELSQPDQVFLSQQEFREQAYRLFDMNLLYTPWNKLYSAKYINDHNLRFSNTFWDDFPFNLSVVRDVERVGITSKKYYHFMRARAESETTKYRSDMYHKRDHGADKNKAVAESEKNWPHLSEFLDWICDTYGENGSDAVWFATNAEVIQYKLLCKMSRLSYTVEGNVLKITLSVPKLDYFNWREFTILVDGLSGGTISESDNVKGLTYGIKNDKFMINANLDTTLETRAEKYVDRFEVYNKEDDKVAAEYFIQRLKPSLRESYLNRLTAAVQPPVLSEFHIHNAETGTNTTSITFYYTANRATHYMVSESSAFEGAEWQPVGDTANVAFVISNTVGEHTLYFKVKNQFGESGVMTYSVIYTPQPVGLTSVTVSNRADNILTIRVSYVGIPSYYRIAETSEGITSAEWTDFVEDITYTYSDVSEGKHYVYVQLKDRWDNVSEVKESFFDVVAPGLTTVIVSFAGADYTTSQEVYNGKTINVTGAATISADRADLILMDTEGNETAGYVINSNSYPNPKVSPAKNNAPTVDDSGVYPAKYISSYVSSNGKIFETPLYFIFNGLAAGNYKIRILPSCNENSSVPANKYANTFYEANGISVNLSFDTTNNKDNFVEIDNVAIGQDGLLTLKLYNTGSMWYRPGMNLVEIIKKG